MGKRGKQYDFDPESLLFYERRKITFPLAFKTLIIIGVAFGFSSFVFNYFTSPEVLYLQHKRDNILSRFQQHQQKVNQYNNRLAFLQMHDEMYYRPVLDKGSIPLSMRKAGTGGSDIDNEVISFLGNGEVANLYSSIEMLENQLRIQKKSYDALSEALDDRVEFLACMPAIQPISIDDCISISSYYGVRYHPIHGNFLMHDGLDFTGEIGSPIYATGKGKVTEIKFSRTGYGNEVLINHGFGYVTRYAHLHEILVEEGQVVERGDLIARLGNTGNSTGPHVHYEVMLNQEKLDPINYFSDNLSNLEYEKITKKGDK